MSPSDDPTSPTEKNRARTSQEPRESPQDSSFLRPIETKMSPSDDPTSPTEKNQARTGQEPRESPQYSSFLSSKEPHETSRSFVSPMNRDEEALKSQYGSFWENPNYFGGSLDSAGNMGSETYSGYANNDQNVDASNDSVDSDTLFADSNKASLPYDNLEGSLDSAGIQTGVGLDLDGIHLSTFFEDSTEDSQLPYDNLEGSLNSAGNNDHRVDARNNSVGMPQQISNSSATGVDSDTLMADPTVQAYANYLQQFEMEGSQKDHTPMDFPTYKSSLEIKFMPTPIFGRAPPKWTFTKILTKDDVDPAIGQLSLPRSFINLHIETHMAEAIRQKFAKQSEVTLKVYDYNWGTMHELRLERRSNMYLLMGDWVKDFVQWRGLCEGDEIGLLCDSSSSRLMFGVVSRLEERAPAEEPKLQKEEIEMMPINRDPWPFKKKLSMTDVNPWAGQVVLPKTSFEPFLREHLPEAYSQRLLDERRIMVNVFDNDTETTHELCLALRQEYLLMSGWKKDFIERRRLMKGQEIGLFWDSSESMFHFSVISSAATEENKK